MFPLQGRTCSHTHAATNTHPYTRTHTRMGRGRNGRILIEEDYAVMRTINIETSSDTKHGTITNYWYSYYPGNRYEHPNISRSKAREAFKSSGQVLISSPARCLTWQGASACPVSRSGSHACTLSCDTMNTTMQLHYRTIAGAERVTMQLHRTTYTEHLPKSWVFASC